MLLVQGHCACQQRRKQVYCLVLYGSIILHKKLIIFINIYQIQLCTIVCCYNCCRRSIVRKCAVINGVSSICDLIGNQKDKPVPVHIHLIIFQSCYQTPEC